MSAARSGAARHDPNDPTPDEVTQAVHEFEHSDRLLLSPARMLPYSEKWVAVCRGDIMVDSDLHSLVSQLRGRGLPLGLVAIRFIEKDGVAA